MEFIYTDAQHVPVGVLGFESVDISIGDSGNEIEVVQESRSATLKEGSLVFALGTEWGGLIRHRDTKPSSDGTRKVTFTGPTWTGLLAERVVVPPAGKDHYRMEGEANSAINSLISYIGLSDILVSSGEDSGIALATDLNRFCNAWDGLREALADSSARLGAAFDYELGKVRLWATQREQFSLAVSSENSPVEITVNSPVNHLVCAGAGELQDRIVVHLYADDKGTVSRTQTIKGLKRIDGFYENTTADLEELVEAGTKKLKELQDASSVTFDIEDSATDLFPLDQELTGYDSDIGIQATTTIGKKVLVVSSDGDTLFRYEPSESQTTTSSLSGSGSGTTVATYSAGKGISISGRTISAEVSAGDLANAAAELVKSVIAEGPVLSERNGQEVTLALDLVTATEANAWFA